MIDGQADTHKQEIIRRFSLSPEKKEIRTSVLVSDLANGGSKFF